MIFSRSGRRFVVFGEFRLTFDGAIRRRKREGLDKEGGGGGGGGNLQMNPTNRPAANVDVAMPLARPKAVSEVVPSLLSASQKERSSNIRKMQIQS